MDHTRLSPSRRYVGYAAALLFIILSGVLADSKPGVPPDKALALLKAGNTRFVLGKRQPANYVTERKKLAAGQQPYAIVLTCSDSRVPPELVFDESLGKIFVVRVAGNVVDKVALGSAEYAVEHLGANFLVVLGHESCGAVESALDRAPGSENLATILRKIEPAAARARDRGLDRRATVALAVEENVREQMRETLKQSEVLRNRIENKKLGMVGAVYHLATGKVEWLAAGPADGVSNH